MCTGHRQFIARVTEGVGDDAELNKAIFCPMLAALQTLGDQVSGLEARIIALVKEDRICRRLMTVPGVSPLIAFTYSAGIDEPMRFRRSRDVGAHFGLTVSIQRDRLRPYQPGGRRGCASRFCA